MGLKSMKYLRVIRKLTQVKVQMETRIDQNLLSKDENGETLPTTENLMILVDFYHTSMDLSLIHI